MNHRLGVIVPYRDRSEQLPVFVERMTKYLSDRGIDNEIIVVHQNNTRQFNRGMLLNIGFVHAEEMGCDYVVFHDVDMLPVDVDYSYCDHPVHMATDFIERQGSNTKLVFDQYFGGVTMFTVKDFRRINGYSNNYWGWGYEDDDLLLRCKRNEINLGSVKLMNTEKSGRYLKFNGDGSFVKCPNVINTNSDLTVFVSFYPNGLIYDPKRDDDVYTVFSIPGYDFSISYTSFSRYNFCAFDSSHTPLYINSDIRKEYLTNVCVTVNSYDRIISMYQDGKILGGVSGYRKLHPYAKERDMYIGVGDPNRPENPRHFMGYFKRMTVLDGVLDAGSIAALSMCSDENVRSVIEGFAGVRPLVHYEAAMSNGITLIDLSGNGNDARMFGCQPINLEVPEYREISVPIRRRSLFDLLPHRENGFENNGWVDKATRWNQLRFHNEVVRDKNLTKNDGLSDLEYRTIKKTKENNLTYIKIGL